MLELLPRGVPLPLRWAVDPAGDAPATQGEIAVEWGVARDPLAEEPESWQAGVPVQLVDQDVGKLRLFVRAAEGDCDGRVLLQQDYELVDELPTFATPEEAPAVASDDPRIVAWAAEVVEPALAGESVSDAWRDLNQALGPAEGTSVDIVSLGEGGELTLSFAEPFSDSRGYDLAVFENSFSDRFLELAFVEVSSDGESFARFDSLSLGTHPVGSYGTLEPASVEGFAGKYRQGYGTPFDLEWLRHSLAVLEGRVDLDAIAFVRIVDVRGDGETLDSFGNPIFDPFPNRDSAGFDLDAVAVLSATTTASSGNE